MDLMVPVKAKCPRCGRVFTVRRLYTLPKNVVIRKFCAYCKDYFVKKGIWDTPEEFHVCTSRWETHLNRPLI